MAIDRKARKPLVNGSRMRFVRFSGRALTQGVVNARIDALTGQWDMQAFPSG